MFVLRPWHKSKRLTSFEFLRKRWTLGPRVTICLSPPPQSLQTAGSSQAHPRRPSSYGISRPAVRFTNGPTTTRPTGQTPSRSLPAAPATALHHVVASMAASPFGTSCRAAFWQSSRAILSLSGRVWSPDGSLLASGAEDDGVRVWDTETYAELYILHDRPAPIRCVLFSPNGQWVVTGNARGMMHVWDAATGVRLVTVPHASAGGGAIHSMVYHPDGVGITVASGGGLHIVDVTVEVQSHRPVLFLQQFPNGMNISTERQETIAISQDGGLLLRASWDDPGRENDFDSGKGPHIWSHPADWTHSHRSARYGLRMRVWDTSSGMVLPHPQLFNGARPVYAVSLSPDGSHVAIAAGREGGIWVWRTDRGENAPVVTFTDHSVGVGDCWITHIVFSPNGAILASGARDGSVFIRGVPSTYLGVASHWGSAYPSFSSPDPPDDVYIMS